MEKCSRNCFECEYDDCINDEMSLDEYKEINRRDVEIYRSRGEVMIDIAAFNTTYSRAYYLSHREELSRRAKERYQRIKLERNKGNM